MEDALSLFTIWYWVITLLSLKFNEENRVLIWHSKYARSQENIGTFIVWVTRRSHPLNSLTRSRLVPRPLVNFRVMLKCNSVQQTSKDPFRRHDNLSLRLFEIISESRIRNWKFDIAFVRQPTIANEIWLRKSNSRLATGLGNFSWINQFMLKVRSNANFATKVRLIHF